jgi:hypothetical protein
MHKEIKSRIAEAKVTFKKEEDSFHLKMDLKVRKKLNKVLHLKFEA